MLEKQIRKHLDSPSHNNTAMNNGNLSSIPPGAVVAFELEVCPIGWEEYEKAYGRFIRGIDKSGEKVDPTGQRRPGTSQEDDFKSHNHTITSQKPLVHRNHGGGACEDLDPGGWACHTELTINPNGGEETRPKNVSLLYCKKAALEENHG